MIADSTILRRYRDAVVRSDLSGLGETLDPRLTSSIASGPNFASTACARC